MLRLGSRGGPASLLLAVTLLVACTPSSAGGGAPASGAAAPTATRPAATAVPVAAPTSPPAPITLRFGLPVAAIGTLDLYIADQRGLFREQGLDVEVIVTGPASQTVQALISSSVDIASAASDSLINAVEKSADLAFVSGGLNRVVYTLIGAKDVSGYADLRGKNLAVSDLRDGSTTLLRRMLQRAGLGPDDVNLLPLGGTPNRAAAVSSAQAAAAVLSQPQDFRMMAEGYPRLGLSTEAVRDYFFQGHAARRAWLRDNGDATVRFLRAVVVADRFMHDPANREAVIAILAEATRSGMDESTQSYDLVIVREQGFAREGEMNVEGLRNVIAILGENGVLEPPLPAVEKYLDLSYLERAQR